MERLEEELLSQISDEIKEDSAYNIRKDGQGVKRNVTKNINIISKPDGSGIDIYVKENTKNESMHIPVIVTKGGICDTVYNDFYIGKYADVVIVAGCGIHNDCGEDSQHNGIHRFFLEEGARVKYIEKHYGEGNGKGKRILNPVTELRLDKGAVFDMESVQIKGVDSTVRVTKASLSEDANLNVSERIMTHGKQLAETDFEVELDGENSSCRIASRSVAAEKSSQKFVSRVTGNESCFSHVECDAIIMDKAKVISIPEIIANHVDANLTHEAAIGKIAGEQLIKFMSLGLSEKEAKEQIIQGFLK